MYQSGKPTIDPTKLAPYEDGTQLCKIQLDEFTARATVTVGVRQEQAQKLYIKLWSLHIDSRTRLRGEYPRGGFRREKGHRPDECGAGFGDGRQGPRFPRGRGTREGVDRQRRRWGKLILLRQTV